MPSRPYTAARLTIRDGVLTSLHWGTDAADLASHVATLAEGSGALVKCRATKVTIRAPQSEELRGRIMAELRSHGVLATCHDPTEPGLPDVEIEVGRDPCSITLRAYPSGVAAVEQLRAALDPMARTRGPRGTLRLRCVKDGKERLVEATEAWLRSQGLRVRTQRSST